MHPVNHLSGNAARCTLNIISLLCLIPDSFSCKWRSAVSQPVFKPILFQKIANMEGVLS